MKTGKLFLAVLLPVILMVGCEDEMPEYYDSKSYALENFNAIELGDALRIDIIQGEQYSVIAKGETPDLDDLELWVENGVLRGNYRHGSRSHKRTNIIIFMPQLNSAKLGAATASSITGFTAPEDHFSLVLSGASTAVVESNYKRIEARVEGASILLLEGNAEVLDVAVGGASGLNARNFYPTAVTIDVNGASEASVNVEKSLTGSVQGSSLLRYSGNPDFVEVFVAIDSRISRF